MKVFLVADTQLYKSLCPSVGRLVGRLVGWLVGWSVGRSVTLELKSGKTRISAPAHPSATGGRVSGLVFIRMVPSSAFATNRHTHLSNLPRGRDFNLKVSDMIF